MSSWTLPLDLQEELTAITETGLYRSEESVLADAVRTLLASRPDLRKAVGVRLYETGRFSIGRACEWTGLNIEEFKQELHVRGIDRQTEDDPAKIRERAQRALRAANRTN